MKTVWNAADRRDLEARLRTLQPDAARKWGSMTAPEMVAHLADCLRMPLGDLPVASKKLPIRYPPLKQLIVYLLPFPKGAPTAPDLVGRVPGSWTSEVADVTRLMDRLTSQAEDAPWPEHPAFGHLTRRAWGVLVYRHTDHHLTQFGV